MVGWEVCCGVGWKEEEVTGQRVQECKWLSAEHADKTAQKPTRRRNSRKWRKSRNSQKKQNFTKPELPKTPSVKKQVFIGGYYEFILTNPLHARVFFFWVCDTHI